MPSEPPQSVLLPRESADHVIQYAKHVKVHQSGVDKLRSEIVAAIKSKRLEPANFSQHDLHPKPSDSHAVDWIFLVDTLNFCFWSPDDAVKYKVEGYTGYFALCAAINRAMKDGIDITNPEYFTKLDLDTLDHIFRSDDGKTQIPLLAKRLECLQEVGERLLNKWSGRFANVVHVAENSAMRLMQLIVEEFPCFRDEALFAGKRVSLYKRAQILIGDLWASHNGEGIGAFTDIAKITMFADYRVPQVLIYFGSLEYSEELLKLLKSNEILENGDAREVEIRAASIYIVEQVRKAVVKEHPEMAACVNSVLIDHFLWDYRRQHAKELEHIPFHKVISIYY